MVVGGGSGGLEAVRHLRRAPVDVTLIDRRNFHLFEPLVYQVATGGLSADEIAAPLRGIFRRQRNVRVLLAEVVGLNLQHRQIELETVDDAVAPRALAYDTLIVATGSEYSYSGHDDWRPFAPEVKSLEGALDVRRRILAAFETAELEPDPEARAAWLTFVVVGAGPTGVETAGQIAEIARDTLRDDFRTIDPARARVFIIGDHERVLPTFAPSLSARAERGLEELGVTSVTRHRVIDIDAQTVTVSDASDRERRIPARTVVWAAGVAASSVAHELAAASGTPTDRAGRIVAEPDLTLPGHPEVIALGDMVRVPDDHGEPLPGLAPVAMQQGRYAARLVRYRLRGRNTRPFRYLRKGDLAIIGRARAVADLPGGVRFGGAPAWALWLGVHLFYLVGFQNRLHVLMRWGFGFATRDRGARLITGGRLTTREARRSAADAIGGLEGTAPTIQP